jgi:hypothetical protein
MMAKSAEARKICRDLDKELEAVGQQQSQTLVWSAQERPIIGLISLKSTEMRAFGGLRALS